MASPLRHFFEPKFDRPLQDVRVHTGPAAAASAARLGARAFTYGSDIVFGGGEWSPESPAGRKLIAHELTHVVQQGDAPPPGIQRQELPKNTGKTGKTGQAATSPPASKVTKPGSKSVNYVLDSTFTAAKLTEKKPAQAVAIFRATDSGRELLAYLKAAGVTVTMSFVARSSDIPGGGAHTDGMYERIGDREFLGWVVGGQTTTVAVKEEYGTSFQDKLIDRSPVEMAGTLFHEMLHIWFVTKHRGADIETGHTAEVEPESHAFGIVSYDEAQYDPRFLARLKRYRSDVEKLKAAVGEKGATPQASPSKGGTPVRRSVDPGAASAPVPTLPAGLTVGPPNDVWEREAAAVAESLVLGTAPGTGREAVTTGSRAPVNENRHVPLRLSLWPGDQGVPLVMRAHAHLADAARDLLMVASVVGASMEGVQAGLRHAIETGHGGEATPEQLTEMKLLADHLQHFRYEAEGGRVLDMVTAVRFLQGSSEAPADVAAGQLHFGVPFFIDWLARGIADYLTIPLGNSRGYTWFSRFMQAMERLGQTRGLLQLELEGSLDHLIGLRTRFVEASAHQNAGAGAERERVGLGAQIGRVARRILLIQDQLAKVSGDAAPTSLDEALLAARSRIDAVRAHESTEEETLAALGGGRHLLSPQGTFLERPLEERHRTDRITQEEAFPATSTRAAAEMVTALADRVRSQAGDMAAARERILPKSPTYSLPEFAQRYGYWFSFFSVQGRNEDPFYWVIHNYFSEMYRAAGMADVEGGLLRIIIMRQVSPLIRMSLGEAKPDFAAAMPAAKRASRASGTALQPSYEYAEEFEGTTVALSAGGELASRRSIIAAESLRTRIRTKDAQEGWSYLVTTRHEGPGGGVTWEPKVMPPEVADYLMGRVQHLQTLQQLHQPGFGDLPTVSRGLEYATATAEQRYLGTGSGSAGAAARARGILAEARRATGSGEPGFTPHRAGRSRVTEELLRELEGYFDDYFENHTEMEYRIAGVLVISEKEHELAEVFAKKFNVSEIAKALAIGLGVQALKLAISRLAPAVAGPVGRAISAIMRLLGESDIASLISLVAWMTETAKVENFQQARVAAYFGQYAAGDLANLLTAAITKPVLKAFGNISQNLTTPRTPRELINDLGPILADPVARDILLREVQGGIARLEAAQKVAQESDPALESLRGLEAELIGVSRMGVDPARVEIPRAPEVTPEAQLKAAAEAAGLGTASRALEAELRSSGAPEVMRPPGDRVGPIQQAPQRTHPTLDQILAPDGRGFTDPQIEMAYRSYMEGRTDPGGPREWVRKTRGGSQRLLEEVLGPENFREARKAPRKRPEGPRLDPADRAALEQRASLGRDATTRAAWIKQLREIPQLRDLSAAAIDRVIARGANVDHLKGQLLEELSAPHGARLAAEMAATRTGEFEFISADRISDAAGKDLTDGMIVRREGGRTEVVMVFESKSGTASARGLRRSYTPFSKLEDRELDQLRGYAIDVLREIRGLPETLGPLSSELLRSDRALIEAIMRDLHTSDIGQVRRDIERLSPNAGAETTTILIDGRPVEVAASPRITEAMGVIPSGVELGRLPADLEAEGLRLRPLPVNVTAAELKNVAESLYAEIVVNGSRLAE